MFTKPHVAGFRVHARQLAYSPDRGNFELFLSIVAIFKVTHDLKHVWPNQSLFFEDKSPNDS